jgi:riboflavin kinase/FMN adenylyltransferase
LRTIAGSASIGAPLTRPILTIGNFDGIHLGHRAILDTVIERARALRGEAVVYTFEPHPRKVLAGTAAPSAHHARAEARAARWRAWMR